MKFPYFLFAYTVASFVYVPEYSLIWKSDWKVGTGSSPIISVVWR